MLYFSYIISAYEAMKTPCLKIASESFYIIIFHFSKLSTAIAKKIHIEKEKTLSNVKFPSANEKSRGRRQNKKISMCKKMFLFVCWVASQFSLSSPCKNFADRGKKSTTLPIHAKSSLNTWKSFNFITFSHSRVSPPRIKLWLIYCSMIKNHNGHWL